MICCFIYKTSENSENVDQCFSKAEDETSLNVSFCPKPKTSQFTVTQEEGNQKIRTFNKLDFLKEITH